MRKLIFISVVLLAILSSMVSAEVVLQGDEVVIDVDYGSLRDDEDELSVSASFTLLNNGTSNESISLSLDNLDSDYDLSLNQTSFDLANGSTQTVDITGTVPVDVDSGNHTIGNVQVSFGDSSNSYGLITDIKSMIELDKIEVYVNGKREDTIKSNNEKIDYEFKPNDEVEFKIFLENLFDDDYDEGDLDGDVTVEMDDNDFGDDVDEDEDFSIDAGEDDSVSITFDVPDDAEVDTYEFTITVDGEDDNNADHVVEWLVDLEVELEDDDVRIEDLSLSRSTVACLRDIRLTVEIKNYGYDDQDHAAISVYNADLDVNELYEDIELEEYGDSDDDFTKSFNLNIGENVSAGTYFLDVRSFINNDELQDISQIDLVVEDCPLDEEEEDEEEETINQTAQDDNMTNTSQSQPSVNESSTVTETVEVPFRETTTFLVLLVLVDILVVVAIVVMIFKLLMK